MPTFQHARLGREYSADYFWMFQCLILIFDWWEHRTLCYVCTTSYQQDSIGQDWVVPLQYRLWDCWLLGTIMGSQHVVIPWTSAGVDIQPDIFYLCPDNTKKYPAEPVSWCRLQSPALAFKYGYHQQISEQLHFLHSHSRWLELIVGLQHSL